MSRLIDADDLIEYIKIWDIGNSISSDQKEFIDCVNKQFTAFDSVNCLDMQLWLSLRTPGLIIPGISGL